MIAHRGNTNGPNILEENRPEYIEAAIAQGYDVEIDIRYDTFDNKFYLGHDESQYNIDLWWLDKYKDYLWIHCKSIEALYRFAYTGEFNYFWHQQDDFTLTSKNYIWTYPGKTYTPKSVIVMPELNMDIVDFIDNSKYNCYGICTDYIRDLK